MTGTCGLTYGKRFAYFDQESRSLRMWLGTGLKDSPQFSGTVPKTGLLSDGFLYELPMQGHPTAEKDSFLLLPSPVAQPSGSTPEKHLSRKPGRTQVTDLAIIVENNLLQTGGEVLPEPKHLLPTPLSRDYKGKSFDGDDMSRFVNVALKLGAGLPPQAPEELTLF